MDLELEIDQHPQDNLCANFQPKWITLNFFDRNLHKNGIRLAYSGN